MSKGTNFEHRIIHIYEKKGWDVLRSAGSLGIADLLAYKAGEKDHLIQCKDYKNHGNSTANWWIKEKKQLIEHCKRVDKIPIWAWNEHTPGRKVGRTTILNLLVPYIYKS